MSSSLSWGNVPPVHNQQRAKNQNTRRQLIVGTKQETTNINNNDLSPLSNQNRSMNSSDSVDEFVGRVTTLSKQVEQYKQLSNQRAQQVEIPSISNVQQLNNGGVFNSAANDTQKKIRSLRQWCTSEANELKKMSNRIGSKLASESKVLIEMTGGSTSEQQNASVGGTAQQENAIKYNRVKNDLTKTICVLKDVIRRDKEWITQQTKQKQEQYALISNNHHSHFDEEEEMDYVSNAEEHPLLNRNGKHSPQQQQQQPLQELQLKEEGTLVSWQESTLNVEMKIAMEEYEDLKQYQSEYYELHHLVTEFASLVDEQDPMLDTIHSNVITSKDNVERGVESLKESNKLRKTQSKMMWIVMGLILLTILAVALILIFGKGVIY
ncbi:hypothetical protein C9374_005809 [Naegleria lovaniensis]|uniref:t-SNARE coiled-coil homology domain-containing protein n=1 Tax=Naegleria lovaniensis TaxID=51637 RepID=A0AA88GPB6_NAELO|nr:uncharacterized protein C9374_005809 [Naegleria lovaniensis]KAG2382017.1 hypothetical protein C9374_005809 [Naegleria lovaniensis]